MNGFQLELALKALVEQGLALLKFGHEGATWELGAKDDIESYMLLYITTTAHHGPYPLLQPRPSDPLASLHRYQWGLEP